MKRNYFKRGEALPMRLQLFADGGAGAESGESAGSDPGGVGTEGDGTSSRNSGASGEGLKQTFDDLLNDKDYQAEFDRRVQKALGTAREKWESLMDDKLSEAEKLAKMTKEEKAQYLQQKRENELADKEAAITRRELMAEAKVTLADKKLPISLAELLTYTDADTCKASIATMEKAFQEAVQAGIEERMKGGEPPKKALPGGAYTKEQVEAMTPDEINKNWETISQAMTTWK